MTLPVSTFAQTAHQERDHLLRASRQFRRRLLAHEFVAGEHRRRRLKRRRCIGGIVDLEFARGDPVVEHARDQGTDLSAMIADQVRSLVANIGDQLVEMGVACDQLTQQVETRADDPMQARGRRILLAPGDNAQRLFRRRR